MASNSLRLQRDDLTDVEMHCIHTARSSGQADVYRLTGDYSDWLLKDFSARSFWIRHLIARRAVRREAKALEGLSGIDGVPRFGGMLDKEAFLMEYLEASRLPHRKDYTPSRETFEALDALVGRMHAAGWAHGDLRRKNILLDADGRPYLIDFATAVYGGRGAGWLGRMVQRRMVVVDRVNIARIKASYEAAFLSEPERSLLERQPVLLKLGRFFRKRVYRPLKRKHRRKTFRKLLGIVGFRRSGK